MDKTKLLVGLMVLILILTPIIVYATAQSKKITLAVSITGAFTQSINKFLGDPLSVSGIFGRSYEGSVKDLISVSGFFFNVGFPKAYTTIHSSPSGQYVYLNGTLITTPHSENLNKGQSYNFTAVASAIISANEERIIFSSWSDGGARSHLVRIPVTNNTYTATFSTEYYLTSTGGSGSGWYASGASVSSSAPYVINLVSGQSRGNLISYTLDGVTTNVPRGNSGDYTKSGISMSNHHSITFNYRTQYYLTLDTSVLGLTVSSSGSPSSDSWFDTGDGATISTTDPQTQGGISFDFTAWTRSVGGVSQANSTTNPIVQAMTTYSHYTANWEVPSGGTPAVGVDLDVTGNSTITLDGSPVSTPDSFHFSDGSSHTINSVSPYGAPSLGVDLNVSGNATILVDGSLISSPDDLHFNDGSSHSLTAYYLGGITTATLNVSGNATITLDGSPVSTPYSFNLEAGTTYNLQALSTGGGTPPLTTDSDVGGALLMVGILFGVAGGIMIFVLSKRS